MLLHLYSISQNIFPMPWGISPFEKPGAAVSWIMAGKGRLQLDDSVVDMEPGACFVLYGTDRTRTWIPDPGTTMVARSFWFTGPGLESWLEGLDAKNQPQFCLRYPQRIHEAYRTMLKLARTRPLNWEWNVHLQLSAVLGEFLLSRKVLSSGLSAVPPAITRVLNVVESDPARDWKITELARVATMSLRSFRNLFHDAMNESPHAHLQRVRLELAREMLTDPTLLIKEIAAKLHFSSEHYFSNFFRQHVGISPTEFRHVSMKSTAT